MGQSSQPMAERFRAAMQALSEQGEVALPLLAELYHEQMQFQDPIQTVHGREGFLEANRRLLRRARRVAFNVGTVLEHEGHLFAVWTLSFEPKLGPTMVFDGATHATVREGQITYQRDYWDLLSSAADALPGMGLVFRGLTALFG